MSQNNSNMSLEGKSDNLRETGEGEGSFMGKYFYE